MNLIKKRIVGINVYFSPRSFGGGTIVAEETFCSLLNHIDEDSQLLFITCLQNPSFPEYHPIRYHTKGVDVIAINIPQNVPPLDTYINEKFARVFEDIIDQFDPDIALIHCLQFIGASFIDSIYRRSVKSYLFLHDCWWLAGNQFMLNTELKYCFESKLDSNLQLQFSNDPLFDKKKLRYLSEQAKKVDSFVYPSEFLKQIYIENGFSPEKSFVIKNGVKLPHLNYKKTAHPEGKVRFGFVGGPGELKGSDLIKEAFETLPPALNNYEIHLVDAAQNLGLSWGQNFGEWDISGDLIIANAYNQETIDDFFKNIDVLLFPSLCKESFGLTVREALCRDVWVIVTDGGGTAEDVVEGINGNVIPISQNFRYLQQKITNMFEKNWTEWKNPESKSIVGYSDQVENILRLIKKND